jgi:uncharacterized metal-binding protein YceD (DUF177 family)
MTNELYRPILVGQIPALGTQVQVDATPAECAALALRMMIPAVLAMRCRFHLHRETNTIIRATGTLTARVVQTCVISMEDFETSVEESFAVRFVPAGTETDDLDPDSDDEIPYENGTLDLGEAAAEQLGLALDPYPRAPDAVLPEVEDEPEAHPFAALDRLRRPN